MSQALQRQVIVETTLPLLFSSKAPFTSSTFDYLPFIPLNLSAYHIVDSLQMRVLSGVRMDLPRLVIVSIIRVLLGGEPVSRRDLDLPDLPAHWTAELVIGVATRGSSRG